MVLAIRLRVNSKQLLQCYHAYLLTIAVMVKYCLPYHYNTHHMQFKKRIKPEPDTNF